MLIFVLLQQDPIVHEHLKVDVIPQFSFIMTELSPASHVTYSNLFVHIHRHKVKFFSANKSAKSQMTRKLPW